MSLFKSIGGKVTEVPNATRKRKASIVSRLVAVHNQLEYSNRIDWSKDPIEDWRDNFYQKIKDKIKKIDYGPDDIQKLCLEFLELDCDTNWLRGAYVGGLISLLTEDNPDNSVEIKLNLENQEFPLLCYGARTINKLYISKVVGNSTCYKVASHGGKADLISIEDCAGSNICLGAASYNGEINEILIKNTPGNYTCAQAAASLGKINLIAMFDSHGTWMFEGISRLAGEVQIVIYKNSGGGYMFHQESNEYYSRGRINHQVNYGAMHLNSDDRILIDAYENNPSTENRDKIFERWKLR